MLNQHVVTEFILMAIFALAIWRRVRHLRSIKDIYEMPTWLLLLFPALAIFISVTTLVRFTQLTPHYFWVFGGLWLLFFLVFTVLGALLVRNDKLVHLKEKNKVSVPGKRMRIVYGGLFVYAISMFAVVLLDEQMVTNYYYQMVTIFIRAIISGGYMGILGTYFIKYRFNRDENDDDT